MNDPSLEILNALLQRPEAVVLPKPGVQTQRPRGSSLSVEVMGEVRGQTSHVQTPRLPINQ